MLQGQIFSPGIFPIMLHESLKVTHRPLRLVIWLINRSVMDMITTLPRLRVEGAFVWHALQLWIPSDVTINEI